MRLFRLSEKRGVSELWNAIDESFNWDKEQDQENFHTMAWTYDIHQDPLISPYWRKWPILLVAGSAKEIKVLDGNTGVTIKVIQGQGGVGP